MDVAIIYSRATLGMQAPQVTIETHISKGIPGFSIVGLPETAIKESRDRVRSAIINSGFEFPSKKITVNLAPADLPKHGSRFDLPIALGILAASGQLRYSDLSEFEFAGELALTGELRPLRGLLPFAIACKNASRKLFVPNTQCEEALLLDNLDVYVAKNLNQIIAFLMGREVVQPLPKLNQAKVGKEKIADMAEVRGQQQAKRALEIAAAGGHSILFYGPPGTGKSMLASRLPGILPEMTDKEALEAAAIASVSHQGFKLANWRRRAFRVPHHSASSVALVGGGSPPKPGEISLAHRGILFLDELPEFSRHVLESLREPLESGKIVISRAARQAEFPASFQLIAAMNPCPCGYLGDESGRCNCTSEQIDRYRAKISGPLLDRIDMQLEVGRVKDELLIGLEEDSAETSLEIQGRVAKARAIQQQRSQCANANLNGKILEKHCELSKENKKLLQGVINKMQLSARSYHRILKVSRTIADLAGSIEIAKEHILEAVSYRNFDRK